jgi:transcriptional regulator with XRE-family HTH domain
MYAAGVAMSGRGPKNFHNIDKVADDGSTGSARALFAQRLQQAMVEKGWNQSDLARQASLFMPPNRRVGRDDISNYIRGVSTPRAEKLSAVTKALGIEATWLLPKGARKSALTEVEENILNSFTDGTASVRIVGRFPIATALELMGIATRSRK